MLYRSEIRVKGNYLEQYSLNQTVTESAPQTRDVRNRQTGLRMTGQQTGPRGEALCPTRAGVRLTAGRTLVKQSSGLGRS
ncbi:hypothetical protein RRG08_029382 [Elysia crispata]|uniref:Uncharacterized protein n=1 Tax=Elysia crispata TaxID=231223 RepID=A0AAE1EBQ1_9GAST|nr:hypothetical protein RRG08_029382 [Elysia crispata]